MINIKGNLILKSDQHDIRISSDEESGSLMLKFSDWDSVSAFVRLIGTFPLKMGNPIKLSGALDQPIRFYVKNEQKLLINNGRIKGYPVVTLLKLFFIFLKN